MTHSAVEGVVLIAHGTVTKLEQMTEFLTAIRRGRPPSAQLVAEMRHRYEAIGGSPLLDTTNRQASTLSQRLGKPVFVGMRFGHPSIEQALTQAGQAGVRRLVVVPLAPYSVQLYVEEVRARLRAMPTVALDDGLQLLGVSPFGTHADLIRAHKELIREFAGEVIDAGASLVLSAHSLPMRVIDMGDCYASETRQSAVAIGAALGVPIELAYQSQGADGGDWLGPDLKDVVNKLAAGGAKRLVVAPFGFLSDHVETRFDLDIELKAHTDALGIGLCRVPALGPHSALIDALVDLVENALVSPPPERCTIEELPC
jgi:ferrochelatase